MQYLDWEDRRSDCCNHESKKDDLEKLSDYTWYHSDTNPGPLHYTGKLCKSNNEIMGYMRDFVYDMYASSYDITLTSEDKTLLDSYIQSEIVIIIFKCIDQIILFCSSFEYVIGSFDIFTEWIIGIFNIDLYVFAISQIAYWCSI